MTNLIEIFTKLDLISLIFGLLLGAIIDRGFDLYIKRPKLSVGGGGGSNRQDGYSVNYISVYNKLGWFGLRIPETRILGLRIHPSLKLGLPFQKSSAIDCTAQLFIADTDEYVCRLWWGAPDTPVTDVKTIRSGEKANLILFVINKNDGRYFPYQPINKDTGAIKIPQEAAYFSESTNFYIRIRYSYNQSYMYKITISKKFGGKFYLESATGSSLLRT